jgi:hypothetical protein
VDPPEASGRDRVTRGASGRSDAVPRSAERDDPPSIGRWTALLGAVAIALTVGFPLVGQGVFHAGDLLLDHAPWDATVPPSFEAANPLLGDTVNNEVPMHAEYRRRVFEGDFPLWLSFPSGGRPLGTVPDAGTLGPLALPYLFAPLWYSPALSKVLEMLVAGGFTALFLRRAGLSRAAALFGGIVFMASGFQVVWTNWPQPRVGAWIPALFWALERGMQERRLGAFLPVPLITAALLLEGFPSVAGYALLAAAAYVPVRLLAVRRSTRERARSLAAAGGTVALGLGLAALQLLPLGERLGGLDLGYRAQSPEAHLPAVSVATTAVPNALGSPADGNYFGPLNYVEIQSFIGVVALLLVGVAFVRWRRDILVPGARAYLWIAAGLAGVLTFVGGPLLALFQNLWLFQVNPVGRVRSVLGFFLACLAATGFESLRRPMRWTTRDRWRTAVLSVLVVVMSVVLARRVWVGAGLAGQRTYVLEQSVIPGVAFVVGAAVIAAGRRVRVRGSALAIWVLPALLVMEATTFASGFLPKIKREEFYPSTPAHTFLRDHLGGDRFASGGLAMAPGTSSYYGLRSLTSNTFYPPTWADAVTVVDGDAFAGSPLLPVLDSTSEVASSPVLDRLGVRYFVTPPEALFGERVSPERVGDPPITIDPGDTIVGAISARRLRGVTLRLIEVPGGPLRLRADMLDESGATVATGSRRVSHPAPGLVVIPVSEPAPVDGDVPLRVRISVSRGPVTAEGDGNGNASLGIVTPEDDGLRLVFADGVLIYDRTRALPRIRWAGRTSVIEDPAARLSALDDPVDPATILLSAPAPTAVGDGAVELVEERSDELVVRVSAAADGYLFVADAMQDGWVATVDGRPTIVRDAEHAAVAVFVPGGAHEVRFRYSPAGWRVGLLVTAGSLVVLLVLISFVALRRGGRRRTA